MTFGILVLVIFVCAAVLMFLRKLPAILALPLMAVAIGFLQIIAGNLTFDDLSIAIIADGAIRLSDPMVISFFGGMLSLLMQKSGIAESLVKRGAELAGDNPWMVALVMLGIIAVLFTTIGGLGAVIMVGTIVLPILSSIGVREHVGAGVVLFGISLGGVLNANNWAVYKSVLLLPDDAVSSYALWVFVAVALMAVVFVTVELVRSRTVRLRSLAPSLGWLAAAAGALALVRWLLDAVIGPSVMEMLRWSVLMGFALILLHAFVVYRRRRHAGGEAGLRWYAYLIPIIPLLLILLFKMSFVTAFLCGLVYGVIVTLRRGSLNMTSRALIEGSASVIPAVVLMIGIGMLLSAILGPTRTGPGKSWYDKQIVSPSVVSQTSVASTPEWPVLTDMKPLLETIVPRSMFAYVFIFSLLGPLALYRGPLNIWGLGYGVGGILLATGVSPGAVMGILMSLGIIQGVSDPTNTQNVWIANELRMDVNTIMWRTLPFAWGVAILGLIVAGMRFF